MTDPFRDFMDPGIDWVQEPDYIRVFQELTGEAPMTHQTGYTMPGGSLPAFINVATVGEDTIQVTVRTESSQTPSRMCMPLIEWQQLVANVARLPFPGKVADTASPVPVPIPYDGKPFATARDPLCQRTDPSLPDDHPDNEGYYARTREPVGPGDASAGDPLGQRRAPSAAADLAGVAVPAPVGPSEDSETVTDADQR